MQWVCKCKLQKVERAVIWVLLPDSVKYFNPEVCTKHVRVSKLNCQGLICGILVLASFIWVSIDMLTYIKVWRATVVSLSLSTDASFAAPAIPHSSCWCFCSVASSVLRETSSWKALFLQNFTGYPENVSDKHFSQLVSDNDAMCCMDAFVVFYS